MTVNATNFYIIQCKWFHLAAWMNHIKRYKVTISKISLHIFTQYTGFCLNNNLVAQSYNILLRFILINYFIKMK